MLPLARLRPLAMQPKALVAAREQEGNGSGILGAVLIDALLQVLDEVAPRKASLLEEFLRGRAGPGLQVGLY